MPVPEAGACLFSKGKDGSSGFQIFKSPAEGPTFPILMTAFTTIFFFFKRRK